MVLPPPLPDPAHIETRLMVVAEMLERAVAEVRRAISDVKTDQILSPAVDPGPGGPATSADGKHHIMDGSTDVDC